MPRKPKPKEKSLTQTVNDNIAAWRKKKGLSQKALADKAGRSVSYVSMLERNRRSPPLETVDAIATALDIPVIALLA